MRDHSTVPYVKKIHWSLSLKIHKWNYYGEKAFDCSKCCKNFRWIISLDIHERIREGERLFNCSKCRKNFQRSISLEIHERIHKGERPFNCSICHKNEIPEIWKSMKECREVGVLSVLTIVRNSLKEVRANHRIANILPDCHPGAKLKTSVISGYLNVSKKKKPKSPGH